MRLTSQAARERQALALACLLFFVVKAVFVVLPVRAMGEPRLGDDSLVYLWTGISTVLQPRLDTPAVRDIVALRRLKDPIGPEVDFARARTTMRTTYVAASPFAMLTGLLVEAGLSHKAAFAISELVVALVLTAGIAALVTRLYGPAAAAVALLLLALAILPQQGLHYLVPSVLALALAALLLAEVGRETPRLVLLIPSAVLLLLTHSIGLVYVAIAMANVVAVAMLRLQALRILWRVGFALVASVLLAYALDKLAGGRPPATAGTGRISLAEIPANLAAAFRFLYASIVSVPVVWLLGVAGLAFSARKRREAAILGALLAGAFLAATAFNLEGYPGELSSRILVMIVIVLSGAAGWLVVAALRSRPIYAAGVIALVAISLGLGAEATLAKFIENMNGRAEVYSEKEIRTDLAALPAHASIMWTDPDISMMAAFLEGAWRFRTLPYPMVEGSPSEKEVIERWRPDYIAAPIPKVFNTRSMVQSTALSPRFYGVSLSDFAELIVRFGDQRPSRLLMRLSGSPREEDLVVAGSGGPCSGWRRDSVNVAGNAWLALDLSECALDVSVALRGPPSDIALTGVSLGTPGQRVAWPWGSAVTIRAVPRDRQRSPVVLRFDWTTLLGRPLAEHLDAGAPPTLLSDRSGIVWLAVQLGGNERGEAQRGALASSPGGDRP
jgi:hypothetical protein